MKMRALLFVSIASAALLLAGCGGGGGGSRSSAATIGSSTTTTTTPPPSNSGGTPPTPSSSAANVATIVVDGGTDGNAINEPFVSVTVCQPGTATCQTIDHILVDTGSSGLRVLASALGAVQLPGVAALGGGALAECPNFASGWSWGTVRRADVKVAGESASSIPIQVVNDPAYPNVPTSCKNSGASMGAGGSANGILGVGMLIQDCGLGCVTNPNNGTYYTCSGSNPCTGSPAQLDSQVVNPAAGFATDNNGVAISLPAVDPPGASSPQGTLTFGIGTAGNNSLGTAIVYTPDSSGYIQTTYNNNTMSSFLDSGSNGTFFQDTGIPVCSSGFYCPTTTLNLQATIAGSNGNSSPVDFTIESINSVAGSITAAPIGGDTFIPGTFDWGLPFFFGRTVYVAFYGASTPRGAGPYVAF